MAGEQKYIHKFRVIRKIEESNFAEIYKAKDSNGQNLVLKIAKKSNRIYNELISREFSILSKFKHPNIVRVFDYDINEDGRAYFTLEFISGKPINRCFNEFTEDFVVAIIQIINSLGTFHNKGFIHSDLKPEHILYNRNEKKVTLIDFGFAGRQTEKFKSGGTVDYMAPEVFKGVSIDQRSDLYSLGIIIYETLSSEKLKDTFKPVEKVPKEINKILARLISSEPTIRPTVPELYKIFGKYVRSVKIKIPPYKVKLPETAFVENPEITKKLEPIRGNTIIINGDVGAGKTRLLQEMRFRYLTDGYSVLYHISREKTNFHESLESFMNVKESNLSNKEEKYQIYEEITQNLLDFAKDKNVIIMLDDCECVSDYELGLFRYIGYGIHGSNIALIGTSNFDEKIKGMEFEAIALRPMKFFEIKNLLRKTFFTIEVLTKGTMSSQLDKFAQWLHKQSGGNPLFLVEILKTLHEHSIINYHSNKWQVKMDLLGKVTIPPKLESLLEQRLNKLNESELKVLRILSLANCPLEPSIISLILKSDANITIENLRNFGLLKVETGNNKIEANIPNHILSQIVIKSISKKEERKLIKMFISGIEGILVEDKNFLPIIAQLSDKIGKADKAYEYYQKSAHHAELIYDYDSALQYYGKILEYEKRVHSRQHPQTLIRIADINQKIGNNKTAVEHYSKAMKSGRKDLLPLIYFGMGRAYSTIGKHDKAVEFLKKARSVADKRKIHDLVRIANRLAYSFMCLRQFKQAKILINQSLLLTKKASNREITADTLYYEAVYEWFQGNYDKGIEKAKNILGYTRKHKLLKQYAYVANLLISLYHERGDIDKEEKYLDQAIHSFKKMKLTNALANTVSTKAFLYRCQGKLLKAQELHKESLTIAQQTNNQTMQLFSLANLACINEDLGKFDEAIEFCRISLRIDPDDEFSNYTLSMLYYRKGKTVQAKSILDKAITKRQFALYYIGLALINLELGKKEYAQDMITKGLNKIKENDLSIMAKINLLLGASKFYYAIGDSEKSLAYAKKVSKSAPHQSKERLIAEALMKICNFKLNRTTDLDLDNGLSTLKNMGCIYDYAHLKRLALESIIANGIEQIEITNIIKELNRLSAIFNTLDAQLELAKIKKIQEKIFPMLIKEYSKSTISESYLKTFADLAELISTNLGDENFIQKTLDLIIQTMGAERGALFISTSKGMDLVAGRNIDRTTINDAGALSTTAIKEMNKNKIVFTQDALSDPDFNIKKSVLLHQIRSILCIPLTISENVIGAVYLDSRHKSDMFSIQDKDFLLTVSKILASVIEKSIAFRSLNEENILLKSQIIKEIGTGYLLGKSKPMKNVYRLIAQVSQTNSPVLLLGETGTGKGMLARLIHLKSKRQKHNFLTINCGTIPETLLESELFGHKKGSFTGAISDKKGLLEEAQAGTIFLDEITNTTPSFQAKLLESIEEKVIRRVGETQTQKIDVRFLFATNKDLEIEVEETRFRKDLYYRINVFSIEVPPLRERASDIPLLALHFIKRYSGEVNKQVDGFTPDAMQKLKEYLWPGNVRELQNIIERAVVLTKNRLITTRDLGFEKFSTPQVIPLKEIKKEVIIETRNSTGGNVKKTADMLGINRKTIQRYIKQYKIRE
jgi:Nif-specific regulatory protein